MQHCVDHIGLLIERVRRAGRPLIAKRVSDDQRQYGKIRQAKRTHEPDEDLLTSIDVYAYAGDHRSVVSETDGDGWRTSSALKPRCTQ
jgi:hypothetical protein